MSSASTSCIARHACSMHACMQTLEVQCRQYTLKMTPCNNTPALSPLGHGTAALRTVLDCTAVLRGRPQVSATGGFTFDHMLWARPFASVGMFCWHWLGCRGSLKIAVLVNEVGQVDLDSSLLNAKQVGVGGGGEGDAHESHVDGWMGRKCVRGRGGGRGRNRMRSSTGWLGEDPGAEGTGAVACTEPGLEVSMAPCATCLGRRGWVGGRRTTTTAA